MSVTLKNWLYLPPCFVQDKLLKVRDEVKVSTQTDSLTLCCSSQQPHCVGWITSFLFPISGKAPHRKAEVWFFDGKRLLCLDFGLHPGSGSRDVSAQVHQKGMLHKLYTELLILQLRVLWLLMTCCRCRKSLNNTASSELCSRTLSQVLKIEVWTLTQDSSYKVQEREKEAILPNGEEERARPWPCGGQRELYC